MYLQKVEIQGFKSFASKTVLTFPLPENSTRGVTAIVGPNGSGKSNISDAVRWVLGEQSMKSIRSKRSEDVIFFGSAARSAVGMSEVSLFFNNDDKAFPLDYSEVVITRRLYRSGESEYIINKSKVRLSDLTLLLAQAHIGQRSYCIVSQGMIDAILIASPSERKGYFDDAAGIREYQIKRDAAVLKLKATEENFSQSALHCKELEPKIRFLERQMKRKEQRAELEKEYQELIRAYYFSLWREYDEKSNTLRLAHTRLAEFRASCEQEVDALQKKLNAYQKTQDKKGKIEIGQLQQELDSLLTQKNTIHATLAVAKSRQTGFQSNATDVFLSLRINETTEDLHRIKTKAAMLEQEIAALEEKEKKTSGQLTVHDTEHAAGPRASLDTVRADLESLAALQDQIVAHTSHEQLLGFITRIFSRILVVLKIVRFITDTKDENGIHAISADSRHTRDSLLAAVHEVRARKERIEQELATLHLEQEQKMQTLDSLHASNKVTESKVSAQEDHLRAVDTRINDIRSHLYQEYSSGEEVKFSLITLQKDLQLRQQELSSLQKEEHEARVELAKIEAKQEELIQTICDEFHFTPEQREASQTHPKSIELLLSSSINLEDRDRAKKDIERLKKTLDSIGSVDMEALNEYETIRERYQFLIKQVNDLTETTKTLERGVAELDVIMEERFTKSMKKINEKFQEYFSSLFNGGAARIVILNAPKRSPEQEDDEVENLQEQEETVSGIDIEASPPGKKLKSISLLSGGERALTAIALLCAILSTNPSPFVVLDEVDASLDESNALRFATILGNLARNTQFIVITHNRVTIHTAHILYGVTMGDDGVSHVISLDVTKANATIAQS